MTCCAAGGGRAISRAGRGKTRRGGGRGRGRGSGGGGGDTRGGGGGNDTREGGGGPDRMSGGAGVDSADYGARTAGLWVSIDNVANDGERAAGATLVTREADNVIDNVEVLLGGAGDDV